MSSSSEDSDREQPVPSPLCTGKCRKFTTKKQAVLTADYKTGMNGVGNPPDVDRIISEFLTVKMGAKVGRRARGDGGEFCFPRHFLF
jgi:hypothetical protein